LHPLALSINLCLGHFAAGANQLKLEHLHSEVVNTSCQQKKRIEIVVDKTICISPSCPFKSEDVLQGVEFADGFGVFVTTISVWAVKM